MSGNLPPGCTQRECDQQLEGDEPLPPPTRDEQEADAWEYWYQRTFVAEAKAASLLHELLESRCPGGGWTGMPKDIEPTVFNCMADGSCGCSAGDAIRKALRAHSSANGQKS